MAGNTPDVAIGKQRACGLAAIGTLQTVGAPEFLCVQLLHEGIEIRGGFPAKLFKEPPVLWSLLSSLLWQFFKFLLHDTGVLRNFVVPCLSG